MFNRYGHIPGVAVGGWAAVRLMHPAVTGKRWIYVRRQRRHAYGHGYPEDAQ